MAITEQDILHISKGKVSYLLLRSSTYFHLIKEDTALTDSKYKKLLKLYPCDLQQLQNLGLHISAFKTENLRHVIVKGYKAGDELELWLGGDQRLYQLAEKHSNSVIVAFFEGISITRKLSRKETELDMGWIHGISWTVNGAAIACALAFQFLRSPYRLWSWLCILFQFLSIILIYLFPGSFAFDDSKAKHHKENKKGNLIAALLAPSLILAIRSMIDFTFTGNAFWLCLLISAVLFCAALLPMVFISRNARNRLVSTVLIVPIMVFLGLGTAQQLNYLLDFTSAESQVATVTDKEFQSGVKTRNYYCTVQLMDGQSRKLSLSGREYEKIQINGEISVTHYEGFFRIPFYKMGDS